jgi:D-sedoheptulose 7-phosphate isomerase
MTSAITELFQRSAQSLNEIDVSKINDAVLLLTDCAETGNRVWLAGNGGSASTASHLAADLFKWGSPPGVKPIRSTCLNDNVALTTALTNDVGWEQVFTYQLERCANAGDVFVAVSVHGGIGSEAASPWSQNLVQALIVARKLGCRTVGLSGFDGGVFGELCDVHLHVPVSSTPIAESVHLLLAHAIADALKQRPVSVMRDA